MGNQRAAPAPTLSNDSSCRPSLWPCCESSSNTLPLFSDLRMGLLSPSWLPLCQERIMRRSTRWRVASDAARPKKRNSKVEKTSRRILVSRIPAPKFSHSDSTIRRLSRIATETKLNAKWMTFKIYKNERNINSTKPRFLNRPPTNATHQLRSRKEKRKNVPRRKARPIQHRGILQQLLLEALRLLVLLQLRTPWT